MSENPYQPGQTEGAPPRTQSTRWLVRSGLVSLGLSALCFVATIVIMIQSFHSIAYSTTTPRPADLAQNISSAMLPSLAVVPLLILGIVLVVAGLVIRRPVREERTHQDNATLP